MFPRCVRLLERQTSQLTMGNVSLNPLNPSAQVKHLGEIIKGMVHKNPDGCEVDLRILREIGLDLKSELYANWLRHHGLRMLKPTHKFICFIADDAIIEYPPDLQAACYRDAALKAIAAVLSEGTTPD